MRYFVRCNGGSESRENVDDVLALAREGWGVSIMVTANVPTRDSVLLPLGDGAFIVKEVNWAGYQISLSSQDRTGGNQR